MGRLICGVADLASLWSVQTAHTEQLLAPVIILFSAWSRLKHLGLNGRKLCRTGLASSAPRSVSGNEMDHADRDCPTPCPRPHLHQRQRSAIFKFHPARYAGSIPRWLWQAQGFLRKPYRKFSFWRLVPVQVRMIVHYTTVVFNNDP